jgi:hypothetical protein
MSSCIFSDTTGTVGNPWDDTTGDTAMIAVTKMAANVRDALRRIRGWLSIPFFFPLPVGSRAVAERKHRNVLHSTDRPRVTQATQQRRSKKES